MKSEIVGSNKILIATVSVAVDVIVDNHLKTAPLNGFLEQGVTIMWFHIPASPAPEHHLCTAAVEQSGSSL